MYYFCAYFITNYLSLSHFFLSSAQLRRIVIPSNTDEAKNLANILSNPPMNNSYPTHHDYTFHISDKLVEKVLVIQD